MRRNWERERQQRLVPGRTGTRRVPLPQRWRDTTTMLLSNPVNREKLLAAIAELNRGAVLRGHIVDTCDDAA